MTEMDEICRKHDIEYVLFAGTSLGAERHGGFIPWDDDADIIMTLPNYEKLLKVMPGELKEGRAFDALEWDPDYLLTYARYVNTDSTAIQRHTLFGGCHPGVKLDVFFVVPAAEDEAETAKHREDILAFSEVVCPTGRMMTYRPEGFYKRYRQELAEAEKMGRKAYIESHLEELKTRAAGSKSGKCILFSGMASNTKLYDSDIFENTVYVPYENTELPISALNSRFSEQHLGRDWMALPADLSQPRHLFLLDTETPYEEYLKAAERKMDLAACKQAAIDKKEHNLYEKEVFRDVLGNNQKIRNAVAGVETGRRLKEIQGKTKSDISGELEAMQDFVKAQLSRSSRVHGLRIGLEEAEIVSILEILMRAGRYYDAENIMRQFEGCLSEAGAKEKVAGIKEQAAALRAIDTALFEKKDFKAAGELIKAEPGLAENACVMTAKGLIGLENGEDPSAIAADISGYIDNNGGTGELYTVLGLCLEREGKAEEAKAAFEEAMKTVRNGYLFQEMVNRGIAFDSIFERGSSEAGTGVKISDVMKGKSSLDPETKKAVKKSGALSVAARLRYCKYAGWVRNVKKPADKEFRKYEDQLFGLTLD